MERSTGLQDLPQILDTLLTVTTADDEQFGRSALCIMAATLPPHIFIAVRSKFCLKKEEEEEM
jgi:hypothetical protein